MPQLDALTYFSQYVYLLITFGAIYYYVLNFIIPKIVGTFKIRQKLNSLNRNEAVFSVSQEKENPKKNVLPNISSSIQLLKVLQPFCTSYHYHNQKSTTAESGNVVLQYDHLLNQAWLANTSQANVIKNQWLVSTVALQLAHNLRLKKLLCDHIVRRITIN
uniref:ATP synthase F0 subunit 8 n=1 Tax=Percursaria percursa TaxID=153906 RepID=A0A8K1N0I8_9CHLO|nr:ATP synthase F0 subunit 8 [Percursaria percursa]